MSSEDVENRIINKLKNSLKKSPSTKDKNSEFMISSISEDHWRVIYFLLNNYYNQFDYDVIKLIIIACAKGNLKSLDCLYCFFQKNISSFEKTSDDLLAASMKASKNGHLHILQFLKKKNVCILARPSDLIEHSEKIIKDLEKRDDEGKVILKNNEESPCPHEYWQKYDLKTPYFWNKYFSYSLRAAVINGHLTVVEYLINNGGNARLPYYLIDAIANEHIEIIKYLVDCGINFQVINRDEIYKHDCETYYIKAVDTYNLKLIKYLVDDCGVKVSCINMFDVRKICKKGDFKLLKFIIKNGSKIDIDCFSYIGESSDIESLKYIIDNGITIDKSLIIEICRTGSLRLLKHIYQNKTIASSISQYDLICESKDGRFEMLDFIMKEIKIDIMHARDMRTCILDILNNKNFLTIQYLISNNFLQRMRECIRIEKCDWNNDISKKFIDVGSDAHWNNNPKLGEAFYELSDYFKFYSH